MFGKTPPAAIVTVPRSLESSSSLRIASWMWRGTMRDFLLSRDVAGQFKNFGGEVFEHGGQVDRGARTDARWRTCQPSSSGRHGRPGIASQPWQIGSWPSCRSFLYLVQTFSICIRVME